MNMKIVWNRKIIENSYEMKEIKYFDVINYIHLASIISSNLLWYLLPRT